MKRLKWMTFEEGPDKGWSWIVPLIFFINHVILVGIIRSMGVLFVVFVETYGISREEATLPIVTLNIAASFGVLLAGFLQHWFGAKPVAITGTLLTTMGISMCYVTTFRPTIFFVGVIYGAGTGFNALFSPVFFNMFFVKYKTIAFGFAKSGASVGTLIFPFVFEYFLEAYDLRGCFLLSGSIVMQTVVTTCLIPSPSWIIKGQSVTPDKSKTSLECESVVQVISEGEEDKKEKVKPNVTSESNENRLEISERNVNVTAPEVENETCTNAPQTNDGKERKKNVSNIVSSILSSPTIRNFREIFRYPMFYVVSINSFGAYLLMHTFLITSIDFSLDKGVAKADAKYVLLVFSITDLVGRIGLGWITDFKFLSKPSFIILCNLASAAIFCALPHTESLGSLMAVFCCFGFFSGASVVLFPMLLADYVTTEIYAMANGLMFIVNCMAYLIIPLVTGYFRDYLGSYENMFYFLGSIITFVTLLWGMVPCFTKNNLKREN